MLQINFNFPGQQGVTPRFPQMLTDATLAQVTAAGFVNDNTTQPNQFLTTDIVNCIYGFDPVSRVGTYQQFTVSIDSAGVVTLAEYVPEGLVTLPVVSGDFAVFDGTSGKIKDTGIAPSDATKDIVAMVDTNHGVGQFVVFTDANGTIGQSGGRIFGTTTAAYAGGGTSASFSAPSVTANSIIVANILTSTNAVSIVKITPGVNTFAVEFSADPGAGTTLRYIFLTTAITP